MIYMLCDSSPTLEMKTSESRSNLPKKVDLKLLQINYHTLQNLYIQLIMKTMN